MLPSDQAEVMADRLGQAALGLYAAVGMATVPLLSLLLRRRAGQGKELPGRFGERRGQASQPRPAGDLVWVHAASVGEVNAAASLIAMIVESGRPVLLTTATVTGARVAERRFPDGVIHQFLPHDVGPYVRRFLAHWRPSLAIFVESELWPNLTATVRRGRIPLIVANGRMSVPSFDRWQRLAPLARAVFGQITLCLAQSPDNGRRFERLGTGQVLVTGNLKFDLPPPAADPEKLAELERAVGDRPVLLAASTHSGEEAILADAHRRLVERFPDLLTIIVPRHPERGSEIRQELEKHGLDVAQRSAGEPLSPTTAIYLGDTLGELGLFFRVARIAFMGGSLVPHGGQNPIEPLALSTAVLHGPHVGNFSEIYAALDGAGQADLVNDAEGLAATVAALLDDPARLAERRARTPAVLAEFQGALAATWQALQPFLAGSRSDGAVVRP